MNGDYVTYFDSFGVEHIPKEIKKSSIYRIQVYNSVMCGYSCIEFIDFMLKDNNLLHYINLFSLNKI